MLFNREECSDKGGTSIGSCAEGYGVCCTCKYMVQLKQMSTFNFKHFWCNEFLAFFGNAWYYVIAFPKNAGN